MASLNDISLYPETDGNLRVSSHLTRGRAATVWFDTNHQPHVMWAVTHGYRNGITEALILEAVAQHSKISS